MDIIMLSLLIVIFIVLIILLILFITGKDKNDFNSIFDEIGANQQNMSKNITESTQNSIRLLGEIITGNQKATDELQGKKFLEINRNITEKQDIQSRTISLSIRQLEERFKTFELMNEQKLDSIRQTMEKRLSYIQEDNNKKLDDMRNMVDEKLQKTLEDKMTRSFSLVNERLEQVYKGLGEMQNLASGVTDLKKVLSNVKTRGILGEIQLGAILKEILSSEQYEENIAVVPNSSDRVEFAVKLPGDGETCVYLPIDSKFPADAYSNLQDAYENGSKEDINSAFSVLCSRIKQSAKAIHDKYIEPPFTTDFAIMFLPFEGLYADVVNKGLIEVLQRDYHINIAGPSTMAALLNSLQLGFKTVAIQKRSHEVWKILGAVKTEFEKFDDILKDTRQKIEQANDRLDKLVGVRTRAIQRKLRDIEKLDDLNTNKMFDNSLSLTDDDDDLT